MGFSLCLHGALNSQKEHSAWFFVGSLTAFSFYLLSSFLCFHLAVTPFQWSFLAFLDISPLPEWPNLDSPDFPISCSIGQAITLTIPSISIKHYSNARVLAGVQGMREPLLFKSFYNNSIKLCFCTTCVHILFMLKLLNTRFIV